MERALGWNVGVLKLFGPVLILAGILGFVLPESAALTSGAPAYNVFHLIFGAIGTVIAFRGLARAAAIFNAAFGAIDLWQFFASWRGLFPAEQFRYKPADDLLHVVFGVALLGLGIAGLRSARRPVPRQA